MKMMKKLLTLFALLAMVFVLPSCDDNGGDNDFKQGLILLGYNHIYEPNNPESQARNKAGNYKCVFNHSKNTVTITATGAFESDGDRVSLTFEDVPFTFSATKGYTFSLAEATPTASDGGTYKVTNLTGSVISYVLDVSTESRLNANTVMQISFTLDGKYEVFSVLQTMTTGTAEIHFTNCDTAIRQDGEVRYSSESVTYLVSFTSSNTADVTAYNTRLTPSMKETTVTFKNVPVVTTAEGYHLTADLIIPMTGNEQLTSYPVKNFSMDITDKATIASVAFNCESAGTVYAAESQCRLLPEVIKNDNK